MDRPFRDSKVAARLALEKSKEESRRAELSRKSADQGHDRRTEPPRPNIKRCVQRWTIVASAGQCFFNPGCIKKTEVTYLLNFLVHKTKQTRTRTDYR